MITLDEATIRELVGLGREELDAVEAVYPMITSGAASMPPIQRIDVPEHRGEIDIKSAYLPGVDGIAVKVSAGFFDNPRLGLPSLGGLMLVFSSTTGVPEAVLLDNGYLTNLRTALAGAVAARHLSSAGASTVGVIGAGVQARLQVEALRLVRPISHVRVWARRDEAAREFADGVRSDLGLEVSVVDRPADACVEGGIVVTTTPSTEALLDVSARRSGLHVTAIGSDAEHKQELSAGLLESADRLVCDSKAQSERLGELRSAPGVHAVELGDVITGAVTGRRTATDVTICDLTGTGAQDTAIASLTVARAQQR